MNEKSSNQAMAFASRMLALPLQGLWFLIKHPIVALILVLLLAFSSFSLLAHYNEAIAERFNSSMKYFLGATLVSEGSEVLRSRITALEADVKAKKATIANKNKSLRSAATALKNSAAALGDTVDVMDRQTRSIDRKNKALIKAAETLEENRKALSFGREVIKNQNAKLRKQKVRLNRFEERGRQIVKSVPKRFSKVAIYDSAGELIGWLPIVGDVASIGLAAGGIYEMCQMFREIEGATVELGVPYMIYTDTFCEKPAEKTKEVIADSAGQVKDSMTGWVVVFADKTSDVSATTTEAIRSFVNKALETLRNLI